MISGTVGGDGVGTLAALMVSPAPLATVVPPAVLVLSSVMVSPAPLATTVSVPEPPSTVSPDVVSGVASAPRVRPPEASVPLMVVSPAWLMAAQ